MLHRGLAELGVVDARDHHHGDVRPQRPQLAKQPVAGLVGEAYIKQHDGIGAGGEAFSRLRA